MANPLLGIGVMLLSTTSMNIGTVLQKKGVDQLPPMQDESVGKNVKGVLSSKIWIFGWILTTLAMVLNMIALGQADITVIQPLIGFGLVVLVVFSYLYLHEKISKLEVIGISIAIIGVIILGLRASESRDLGGFDEILSNYTQINAIIILVVLLTINVVLWIVAKKIESLSAGILFAIVAAIFSVIGLTFSKGLFSIIDAIGLFPSLGTWQAWVLLACFMSCSTMAIVVQQMSLQRGRNVVVTPVFNLASIIFPLATGFMVFSETIDTIKIIATLIILVGAVLLSIKKEEKTESDELNDEK